MGTVREQPCQGALTERRTLSGGGALEVGDHRLLPSVRFNTHTPNNNTQCELHTPHAHQCDEEYARPAHACIARFTRGKHALA